MSEKKKPGLLGYAVVMSVITIISKALGLLRDVLVGRNYGTDVAAQAYAAASSLPVMIFDFVIGGVVTAAFIPVFNSILVKKGKKEALEYANSYVNFILIATAVIAAAGVGLAPLLVRFVAPELSAEATSLAVQLTRIMFPMIIFTGLAFSFVGILQSLGEYNIPALISLVSNVIMVGYLFALNWKFGIFGLAVAMVIGWAAQAFIQAPKLLSFGYRYRPALPKFDESLKRSLKSALPILIGMWTTPVCTLINNSCASSLNEGRAIAALSYSSKLYIIIVGVFSFVATNLLFPKMSKAEAGGDREETTRLIRTSSKTLVFVIAPITVGLMMLARPFIALVYERGEFTPADTLLTSDALRFYCVGMIFMAVNEVLVKSLFAAERPRAPMVSSICSMSFNVLVIWICYGLPSFGLKPLIPSLGEKFGIGGIALVAGLATVINFIINAIFAYRKKICRFTGRDVLDAGRSIVAAAAMIPALWFIDGRIGSDVGKIGLGLLAGIAIYFIASVILRSEETATLFTMIRGKLGKKGEDENG